jgi:hypothetical protein
MEGCNNPLIPTLPKIAITIRILELPTRHQGMIRIGSLEVALKTYR